MDVFLVSKYIIAYSLISICLIIVISFILLRSSYVLQQYSFFFNLLKYLIIILMLILFFLNFFKFFLNITKLHMHSRFSFDLMYSFETVQKRTISSYNVGFSDSIVLLAIITGMVCVFLLGDKNINVNLINVIYFSFFTGVTICMVYTVNLLVMFISFEFIFVPTIYFVYKLGYVKKTDKTIKYLLQWTLTGAFLILITICYIYAISKTMNIFILINYPFSIYEKVIIYLLVFIGFGIKIPVYPFHFWLTKVHVEAPAGFSIFLSGFLVKTAVYCFGFFNTIFSTNYTNQFVLIVALLGMLDASIKMWSQLDIKKLIAFATIQEMNIILLFLILTNFSNDFILIIFIFVHGLLSTLMFFLVDLIQKRTTTRNIIEIGGLSIHYSKLRQVIWGILIFFMGFPLTIKFLVEWKILFIMYSQSLFITLITFMVLNIVAIIGFAKQIMMILYGSTGVSHEFTIDLSKRDFIIIIFIAYILFVLNFFSICIA